MNNFSVQHWAVFDIARCDTADMFGRWYPGRVEYIVRNVPFDCTKHKHAVFSDYGEAFDHFMKIAEEVTA